MYKSLLIKTLDDWSTGFPPGGDEHTMINMYNFGSLKFPESEDLSIDVECK
jgi:hypothetical protein